MEPGWIYFGIPCIKLKENKLASVSEMKKRDVDEEKVIYVDQEINNDEKKKDKLKQNKK